MLSSDAAAGLSLGSKRIGAAGLRVPWHGVAIGEVVPRTNILDVADGRWPACCDAGEGYQKVLDVRFGRVDPAACPDGPGHPAAVASAHLVSVVGDLFVGEPEEPHQVGMGAEATVPDADAVFGREPRSNQSMRYALHGEGCDGKSVGLGIRPEDVHTGTLASPSCNSWARWRSCSTIADQPISPRASIAACSATAPITFGEPASSRSGGSVQTTSSSSTRSTAPPPARNGSPSAKAARGPTSTPAPKGAYILCPLQATKSASRGRARCGASWAPSTATGTPRSCAADR